MIYISPEEKLHSDACKYTGELHKYEWTVGARGTRGWLYAFVESSGERTCANAIEKADSTPEGYGRVSRGNKFRQIVLPALYTVAHEVERVRAFPSSSFLTSSTPRSRYPPSPPCRYRRFGVPLWVRAPSVIADEEDMRLVPPERKRCHFLSRCLPRSCQSSPFYLLSSCPPSLFPRVFALLILSLGINPLLCILRTYFRFSYCDRRARSPDRRDLLSPHLHAVMHPLLVFPALSSALIPTRSTRVVSPIFPH